MKYLSVIFFSIAFITSLSYCSKNQKKDNISITNSFEEIEKNKGKIVLINTYLRKFTPWKKGKGRGDKFWKYEIVLNNRVSIPATMINKNFDPSPYLNKIISMKAKIFYGFIVGDEKGQSMTGYRIDVYDIN